MYMYLPTTTDIQTYLWSKIMQRWWVGAGRLRVMAIWKLLQSITQSAEQFVVDQTDVDWGKDTIRFFFCMLPEWQTVVRTDWHDGLTASVNKETTRLPVNIYQTTKDVGSHIPTLLLHLKQKIWICVVVFLVFCDCSTQPLPLTEPPWNVRLCTVTVTCSLCMGEWFRLYAGILATPMWCRYQKYSQLKTQTDTQPHTHVHSYA